MTTSTTSIHGHRHVTNTETHMYGLDLLARERQASLEQDAERRWRQHRLEMDAMQARRSGVPQLSLLRRTRIRAGETLVSTGLAIAGPADDGRSTARLERPA